MGLNRRLRGCSWAWGPRPPPYSTTEATQDKLSRYSGASYGTRAVAYLRGVVEDNVVGLTALRAFAAEDLATLMAYAPIHAYNKLLKKAPGVRRGRLGELPLEERLAVELGRVLKDAKVDDELKPLAEAFERGEARVEKRGEGKYVIYAGGKTAELKLMEGGGAKLHVGELTRPLVEKMLKEARRAVEIYERMRREDVAPLPSREAQDGWLLSDVTVRKGVVVMGTTSLEQVVTFLSAFGVRAEEIHWGEGKKRRKPVKIYVDHFNVTSEGLRPVYRVELYRKYAEEVWDRLSSAPNMSEKERKAVVNLIIGHLDRKVLETLDISPEEFRRRLEGWLGEWPNRAPKITRWDKDSRVFHTLINVFRELARSEEDAGKREVARRRAVGMLLHDVLGDGSVYQNEIRLFVGKGKKMSAGDKAALYYALLRELGYQPKMYEDKGVVFISLYGGEARRFAGDALPYLVSLERMLEVVKGDEQIYSKIEKIVDMARAERAEARVEGFKKGRRPWARLVVRLGGEEAEYPIYLHKKNMIVLYFNTTNSEEAERRAAVLRAVGVKADVDKYYDKSRNRDVWHITVTTNALAADSVHEAVRRAVAEFLQRCREAGAVGEDTYRRLAGKFERGVPEWGEVRFSVKLGKKGVIEVMYRPRDPQSFSKAVEFLRGLGMRDSCEGDWCVVHFTAREPEGGRPGFIRITTDGLRYIRWLALHGEGEAREKAQRLKEMLLKEAEAKGVEVRRRLEQYFREGEQWGSVKPPFESEVEVEGRLLKVRVEAVEAWREKSKTKEHLVVKIKAKVIEGNSEVAVEKEARFYKRGGVVYGYVNIHASAEGGREADYQRTAAVLKALGIERWGRKEREVHLTGGALEALMRLKPVCAVLGVCRKK